MGTVYKYEKLMLGVVGEVIPYDFTNLGWNALELIEALNKVLYDHLINRPLLEEADWSVRTRNMFLRNRLTKVGQVLFMDVDHVNRLAGCGYQTRKNVYEEFQKKGIDLPAWKPEKYWEKYNGTMPIL